MAKEVLVTHDPTFIGRPERLATNIIWYDQEDMAFSPYCKRLKQMRKTCMMELLSGKNVLSFSFIWQDEMLKLSEPVQSSLGVPINVIDKFLAYASSMTCRPSFGRICKDKEKMIEYLKKVITLAVDFDATDVFPSVKLLPIISRLKSKSLKMHHKMDAFLDDVIDQHKLNPKNGKMGNAESGDEDLIDSILRQQESGNQISIASRNINGIIFDIFTAGTDTSSAKTKWAMSELMKHPRVMAKAQTEIRKVCKGKKTIHETDIQKLNYLKMVIKKTLRLHPPIPLLPRASRENCVVNGYMIPDKAQVMVNVWAIGRDPQYWDEPKSFKPERFEQKSIDYMGTQYEYLPFGTGRRTPPGIALGLANVEIPLAHLLYHFDWKLPNGMKANDLDMNEVVGITVGRKNNLYLVATKL